MDKFRMIFQYFQSSSESVMNGICLILAVATVKIYSSFDFNCPCLPQYNALYGLGLLFTPPLALFLCGLIANRQSVVLMEEWRRPTGRRKKDPGIVKYLCSSVLQRALAAPAVWVLLALLDGKCFICAFSGWVDPNKFADLANMTASDARLFLTKVPCKDDALVRDSPARKAVSRYLRCLSQALGWSIMLTLIVVALLARSLQPCFDQSLLAQRRYWSNYVDLEQKLFDETCCEHARDFAQKCVLHFFHSMRSEMKARGLASPRQGAVLPGDSGSEAKGPALEEGGGKDLLHGVANQKQVNRLLTTWYRSKPPLDVTRALQPPPGEGGGGLSHRGASCPSAAPQHTDV
ncbi:calcium homeostasis modulator protein 3 [Sminthopsis crassicaudata]|uniref:calcium homeostasis modulator protein 3 n=1 Tax=Sminthopsis crassicaudata TaxID=9301 RepID=UPI003D681EAF